MIDIRFLPLLVTAFGICAPIRAAVTIYPLVDPSFEEGGAAWDGPTDHWVVGELNGAPNLVATDGVNYWGGLAGLIAPTPDPNAALANPAIGQTVDVSSFASIDSVTFGADVFGVASVLIGAGHAEFVRLGPANIYLNYLDADGGFIGTTFFEFPSPANVDAMSGFSLNDLRGTDTSVPAGTHFIEFTAIGFFVADNEEPHEAWFDLEAGFDDMFLSVTGTPAVPEPAASIAAISAALACMIRRRRFPEHRASLLRREGCP